MQVNDTIRWTATPDYPALRRSLSRDRLYKITKVHYAKPLIQIIRIDERKVSDQPTWFPKEAFKIVPNNRFFDKGDLVRVLDDKYVYGLANAPKGPCKIVRYHEEETWTDLFLVEGVRTGKRAWIFDNGLVKIKTRVMPAWF